MISISKAEHLTLFWHRGRGNLEIAYFYKLCAKTCLLTTITDWMPTLFCSCTTAEELLSIAFNYLLIMTATILNHWLLRGSRTMQPSFIYSSLVILTTIYNRIFKKINMLKSRGIKVVNCLPSHSRPHYCAPKMRFKLHGTSERAFEWFVSAILPNWIDWEDLERRRTGSRQVNCIDY